MPGGGPYIIKVLNPTECAHCHHPVSLGGGVAFALGSPYSCMLHLQCAPHFSYSGEYPHPFPAVFYQQRPPHTAFSLTGLRTSQDDISIRR